MHSHGHGGEFRKKSCSSFCPRGMVAPPRGIVARLHGSRSPRSPGTGAQVTVLYSIAVPTGVHRRSLGARPVLGRCTAIRARSPGHGALRQLFYVFNQPETHNEPSGSLSLSLSVSLSLCLSVSLSLSLSLALSRLVLRKLNWYYCDGQCC